MEENRGYLEPIKRFLGPETSQGGHLARGIACLLGAVLICVLGAMGLPWLSILLIPLLMDAVWELVTAYRYKQTVSQVEEIVQRVADQYDDHMMWLDFTCAKHIDPSVKLGEQFLYMAKPPRILHISESVRAELEVETGAGEASSDTILWIKWDGGVARVSLGPKHLSFVSWNHAKVAEAVNAWTSAYQEKQQQA